MRIISAPAGSPQAWRHGGYANYQEGTATPNAIVLTGYGPPEVLKWAEVPLVEPGEGQIRIKVKAAGRPSATASPPCCSAWAVTPNTLRLRAHESMPMQQAAEAHRQLESGNVHERIILTLE